MTRSRLVNLFKVFMLLLRILPPMLSGHLVREGLSRCTRGTRRLWRRRLTQDLSRVGARLLPLGPCGRESMAGRSGAHGPRRPAWGLCRRDRAVASHPLWTGPLLSCPSSTGPPGRPAQGAAAPGAPACGRVPAARWPASCCGSRWCLCGVAGAARRGQSPSRDDAAECPRSASSKGLRAASGTEISSGLFDGTLSVRFFSGCKNTMYKAVIQAKVLKSLSSNQAEQLLWSQTSKAFSALSLKMFFLIRCDRDEKR